MNYVDLSDLLPSPSPSPQSHHVGVSVQRVPVAEGVLDPVFGEDGQPAADHTAGGEGGRERGNKGQDFHQTSCEPAVELRWCGDWAQHTLKPNILRSIPSVRSLP